MPPTAWSALAESLIPDADLLADLLPQARAVLEDPAFAPLFAPGSLAEVAVSAPWNGRRLAGTIDRLVVGPDHVLIVDYKSNSLIPDLPEATPEGILRQLGAYAHMVAQVYPERRIETSVLWTRRPVLMPVDPEIVRLALARATIP